MFDYAHSDVKSEFMDCWLWTQCRWWTGNSNGASVIPFAFNKPRLMVDQWYWEMNGRETDIVIPKLPVQNGRVMAIKDVFHSKYSRTISLARLRSDGITILNNSPQEIVSGASEMLNLLENGTIDKNTSVNLEMLKFFSQKTKNVMTISPSFAYSWAGDLIR